MSEFMQLLLVAMEQAPGALMLFLFLVIGMTGWMVYVIFNVRAKVSRVRYENIISGNFGSTRELSEAS